MAVRKYAWCFTLNNYTSEEVTYLHTMFSSEKVRYFVYGKEVGAQGTPHLQGYVHWKTAKTLSACKKAISPRAHVEVARLPKAANTAYCKKDGNWTEYDPKAETERMVMTPEEIAKDFMEHQMSPRTLRRFADDMERAGCF